MPVPNAQIAEMFERYASLLEIEEANAFRVRAYRKAARTIQDLPQSVASMLERDADLSELAGIGKDLAGKIAAIVETGKFAELEDLEHELPGELAEVMAIPGLGPKRVRTLHRVLGIDSLDTLRDAAQAGRIRDVTGFGSTTEANILKEVERRMETAKRFRLLAAEQIALPLLEHLRACDGVKDAVVAGSYRRRRETVGDLDILVTATKGSKVIDRFVGYENVAEIVSKGKTRSTVRLHSGMQVDLRVVPQVSYGAALHYFTGSRAHNIATRKLAVERGLKLNEYGVFRDDSRIAGRTEEEVYAAIDLPYIEPELREDRGEIDAAKGGRLPRLVALDDIRGDLHAHTTATDGRNSAEEMASAARQRGYDYLAITDHSRHVTVAKGLDPKRLRRQLDEIDALNGKLKDFRLLKSSEVDILDDGSLDLPDSVLRELDLVVCSIHYKFDLSREKQTERIMRALDNMHVNILAHPTGRLVTEREPYAVDIERIMKAALERGCFLEINAQPARLDLSDQHARMAKEMGLKLAISTDSHATTSLDYMRFGIDQARRAWLGPQDVLNTRSWAELKKLLKRR